MDFLARVIIACCPAIKVKSFCADLAFLLSLTAARPHPIFNTIFSSFGAIAVYNLLYQASITSPVVLATRTFLPPSILKPTRVALPSLSIKDKFEISIGIALGKRPP